MPPAFNLSQDQTLQFNSCPLDCSSFAFLLLCPLAYARGSVFARLSDFRAPTQVTCAHCQRSITCDPFLESPRSISPQVSRSFYIDFPVRQHLRHIRFRSCRRPVGDRFRGRASRLLYNIFPIWQHVRNKKGRTCFRSERSRRGGGRIVGRPPVLGKRFLEGPRRTRAA